MIGPSSTTAPTALVDTGLGEILKLSGWRHSGEPAVGSEMLRLFERITGPHRCRLDDSHAYCPLRPAPGTASSPHLSLQAASATARECRFLVLLPIGVRSVAVGAQWSRRIDLAEHFRQLLLELS